MPGTEWGPPGPIESHAMFVMKLGSRSFQHLPSYKIVNGVKLTSYIHYNKNTFYVSHNCSNDKNSQEKHGVFCAKHQLNIESSSYITTPRTESKLKKLNSNKLEQKLKIFLMKFITVRKKSKKR